MCVVTNSVNLELIKANGSIFVQHVVTVDDNKHDVDTNGAVLHYPQAQSTNICLCRSQWSSG